MKNFILIILFLYNFSFLTFGKTTTWTGITGINNWFQASNWDNGLPANGDDVIIDRIAGGAAQISNTFNNTTLTLNSLTINTSNALNTFIIQSTSNLTITGNLTINGNNTDRIARIDVEGTLICNGNLILNGNESSQAQVNCKVSTSIFELGGNIIFTGKGDVDFASSGLLRFIGTNDQDFEIVNSGGNIIRLHNVEVNKPSGTLTLTNNFTFSATGDGIYSGYFNLAQGHVNLNGFSLTGGAAYTQGAGSTLTIPSGNFPTGFSSYTFSPNATVNLTSNSAQNIGQSGKSISFGRVTCSGSGTKTIVGTSVSIQKALILNSNATTALTINGSGGSDSLFLGGSNTLTLTGSASLPTTFSTTTLSTGSTVNYAGVTQTISAATYSNLTVSAAGTKTCASGVNVSDLVSVTDGTLESAGNLTLISNASGTAAIGPITGSVTGNVNVQRHIHARQSVAGNPGWWYLIGSPIQSGTLNDLIDDFDMTGFTGSTVPSQSFTSVYTYTPAYHTANPTDIYTPADNITNTMTPGQGFYFYIYSTGSAPSLPLTADFVGQINSGNVNLDLDLNGANHYNLISNPYPSPVNINIDTMGSNVTEAQVMKDDGTFVSVNGGVVGVAEAFWVRVNDASATFTFAETDKTGAKENDVFNKSARALSNYFVDEKLVLKITRPGGTFDESIIAINEGVTNSYDAIYDCAKLANFYNLTNLSFTYGNDEFSINQIPSTLPNGQVSFPIKLWRDYPLNITEQVTFEIKNVELFKQHNICLTLEDKKLGTFTSLSGDFLINTSYTDTDTNARFVLHLRNSFTETVVDAECYGEANGSIELAVNPSGFYNYYLTNSLGDTLTSTQNHQGSSYQFNNLAADVYRVHMNDNDACGLVSKSIEVSEPEQLISMFTFPNQVYDVSTSAVVNFSNQSSAHTTDFYWNFGDGTTLQGIENPIHEYTKPGSFQVELAAISNGCTDTSFKTIEVIQTVGTNELAENNFIGFRQSQEQLFIDFSFDSPQKVQISITNTLGQIVYEEQGVSFQNQTHTVNLPEAAGTYLISLKYNGTETHKKIVKR